MRNGPPIFLVAFLLLGCQPEEKRIGLPLGSVAPDFGLETLEHSRFYLNQQRDRVVVLGFWITTCQICKREMVELANLEGDFDSHPLTIVSVCGDPENLDAVRRIIEGLEIKWPVLLDHGGEVAERYNVQNHPTTVVVNQEGKIAMWIEGWDVSLRKRLATRIQALFDQGGNGV
jgi:peroxiredoxin